MEMPRPGWPNSEAHRAERVDFLRRGCSLPHQLEDLGERCKLPQRGPGQTPGVIPGVTFCRLTKPLLMSILLILNLFQ